MKEVALFGITEKAKIDDDDYEIISKYKWFASPFGHHRTLYARTNVKDEAGCYKTQSMHRLVMGLGDIGGEAILVDHINGNGLDNRKENLRIVSPSENAANVKVRRDNSSGYKGVSFRKDRGTWQTEIRKNYINMYKSTSKCKHAAAHKYNINAVLIHGEYAWLNTVEECDCIECDGFWRTSN